MLHTIKRRKVKWIGRFLLKNCLLKHVTELKVERKERRGRRRKQLLDCLKKTIRYWTLKEKASYPTVCSTRFGRG